MHRSVWKILEARLAADELFQRHQSLWFVLALVARLRLAQALAGRSLLWPRGSALVLVQVHFAPEGFEVHITAFLAGVLTVFLGVWWALLSQALEGHRTPRRLILTFASSDKEKVTLQSPLSTLHS